MSAFKFRSASRLTRCTNAMLTIFHPMLLFHFSLLLLNQIGPVLIKNDLDEAIDTVKKRLEFITGEM